jgi:tetratricopeptide (TPR) repeat protein
VRTLRPFALTPLVLALALAPTPGISQPRAPSAPARAPAGPLASALEKAKATDYAAAEKELLAIQGPDRPAAMIALARIMREQGRYADVEKYAQQAGPSRKGEAVAVRSQALFESGKTKEALALLETAKDEKGVGGRRVRLLLGEYRIATGKRDDAEAPLMSLIDDYNNDAITEQDGEGLALAGRAAYLLRSVKDANELFKKSLRADRQNVEMLLWHAQLFLEKYDPGHAEESLKDALKVAPKNADAIVAMAEVKLEQTMDFDTAEALLSKALAVNPKHVRAHFLRAGLALRDMDIAAADKAVADGLATNPNDLELWSMKAATRFLADDPAGYEAAKRETFTRNPQYSHFFSIVSEFAEWEHRYDDMVSMMQEAVKVDPKDGFAWGQLGLMQLRQGDEKPGLENLRRAFSKDSFNVRVYNTLDLYEKNLALDYDLIDEGPFKIRYPKRTEDLLRRYVPQMMTEAWASMKSRYGFVPQGPVQVEMYEQADKGKIGGAREQFGVRTAGLPGIGIQGVCFGKVIAAMGPHSEPFNWGNVLWHELGHVFAIQLSKNHVPRWFTEGLSEYETIARRPEWQRELDPQLYMAIVKNRLPSAVDMNRAFTHAESPEDITVAYYASSQMLVFTVQQFGMPKVVEALKLWGQGVRTPDVLQRAFGLSAKDYDAKFRAWMMGRLERFKGQFILDRPPSVEAAEAAAKKSPNDAQVIAELALAHAAEGQKDKSIAAMEQALKLDPKNQTAHYLMAKLSLAKKDPDGAVKHLEAIRSAGGDGYKIQMALADLAEKKEDAAGVRAHLEAAWRFDPRQGEPLQGLYDLAKEEKRFQDEIPILRKLAPLDQHDGKVWALLLDKLVEHEQWDEAKSVGEAAVFAAVGFPTVHVNYGKALAKKGELAKALYEFESATLCQGKPDTMAKAHAAWAAALLEQKNVAEAKKHRDEALKLDANCKEAKALSIP